MGVYRSYFEISHPQKALTAAPTHFIILTQKQPVLTVCCAFRQLKACSSLKQSILRYLTYILGFRGVFS